MKTHLAVLGLVLACNTALHAQIDLTKEPGKTSITKQKSNAQLLKESQPVTLPNSDTGSLNKKFNTTATPTSGTSTNTYMNNNAQPMNSQSQQYNLGGAKATNNVYYDNSGKIQGSGTTIEFNKKK